MDVIMNALLLFSLLFAFIIVKSASGYQ